MLLPLPTTAAPPCIETVAHPDITRVHSVMDTSVLLQVSCLLRKRPGRPLSPHMNANQVKTLTDSSGAEAHVSDWPGT